MLKIIKLFDVLKSKIKNNNDKIIKFYINNNNKEFAKKFKKFEK